jgi:hypothetical protein
MWVRLRADKAHRAGGWRVHRYADKTIGVSNQLAFEYLLANGYNGFGGSAEMLSQR